MNLQNITNILKSVTNIAKYLGTHVFYFISGITLIIILLNLKKIVNFVVFIILFLKIKSGEKENVKKSESGIKI